MENELLASKPFLELEKSTVFYRERRGFIAKPALARYV